MVRELRNSLLGIILYTDVIIYNGVQYKSVFLNLNHGSMRNISGFFYVYKSLLCNSKQVNYLPIHV